MGRSMGFVRKFDIVRFVYIRINNFCVIKYL